MYTKESIHQLIQALEQKMHQTMQEKNYKQAGVFGQALDQLTAWLGQGQPGPLPQEIQEIPDLHWQSILQEDVPSALTPEPVSESMSGSIPGPDPESSPTLPLPDEMPSESAASDLTPAAPDRPSDRPSLYPEIEEGLTEISRLIGQGNLVDARAQLEVLTDQALSPQDQQIIEGQAAKLRAAEGRALTQAREQAQSIARNQPDNYAGQQEAWRAVQRLDPGNQEAANALAILSSQILAQSGMNEIQEIRRRLPELSKKISLVEEARRRVNEMRYDSAITDPTIQAEVEKLYTELDDARNAILKASDQGTSMERSKQYETAITVYRNAIRQGLTEIVDDEKGDPIDPQVRLTETLRKYWADLIKRSSQRYTEAEQSLQDGVPEVAKEKLEEAQSLLSKVEEGGDEWGNRVEQKLEEARISLMRKGEADTLVRESGTTSDPQHARTLLLQAQDKYPRYPRLTDRIRIKEDQILEGVLVEMRKGMSRAKSLLKAMNFDGARAQAEQMLDLGKRLDFVNQPDQQASPDKITEFQTFKQEAWRLLDQITDEEGQEQRFQQRVASIRAALDIPDARLARSLLDAIPDFQRDREEIATFRVTVSQMGTDNSQWLDAQKAFDQGRYEETITLCQKLSESRQFQVQAAALQVRAQIRQQIQQAQKAADAGRLEAAREIYRTIQQSQGVSSDDQPLIESARQEEQRLDAAIVQRARFDQQFDELASLRAHLRWSEWLKQLRTLEETANKSESAQALHTKLLEESTRGLNAWKKDAKERVEEIRMRQDDTRWRDAFTQLQPLVEEGMIARDDADYREIATRYHRYEADLRAKSRDPRDQEDRVRHLRELLSMALPPALQEKADLATGIRQWALRQAEFAAANTNPTQAMNALQEILDQNEHELKEDPEIWSYLAHYALQADDFERAASASRAIGFIAGQSDLSRAWQQLVSGIQTFQQGSPPESWTAGINGIADTRRLGVSNILLERSLNEFSVQMADQLYTEVTRNLTDTSNKAILDRVRIYALMLQLNPNDARARARLNEMAERLKEIGRELMARIERLKDSPLTPQQEIDQLDGMLTELQALVSASDLLPDQQGDTTHRMRSSLNEVERRKLDLQRYLQLSADLEKQYAEAIARSWDTKILDTTLRELQNAAREAEIRNQGQDWPNRIRTLSDVVRELESALDRVERSWTAGKYDDTVTACDELGNTLRQGQTRLNDRRLTIPEGKIVLYDEEVGSLQSLDSVRKVADAKSRNQKAWDRWCDQYDKLEETCLNTDEKVKTQIRNRCLSEAQKTIAAHIRTLNELDRHREQMPQETLTQAARKEKNDYEESMRELIPQIEIERQETLQAEIERQIAGLEEKINRVDVWLRKANMKLDQNRTLFENLIKPIQEVDACHPELVKWLERYKAQ